MATFKNRDEYLQWKSTRLGRTDDRGAETQGPGVEEHGDLDSLPEGETRFKYMARFLLALLLFSLPLWFEASLLILGIARFAGPFLGMICLGGIIDPRIAVAIGPKGRHLPFRYKLIGLVFAVLGGCAGIKLSMSR